MNTSHFPAMQHFLQLLLTPNICFVRGSSCSQMQTLSWGLFPSEALFALTCKGPFRILLLPAQLSQAAAGIVWSTVIYQQSGFLQAEQSSLCCQQLLSIEMPLQRGCAGGQGCSGRSCGTSSAFPSSQGSDPWPQCGLCLLFLPSGEE